MANYNGLRIGVLSDSINSVLQSSFPDFELIIVDNGSTDGSADFLQNISQEDPRVRPLFRNRNAGYSAANNHAVHFARGEFLGFLHNDTKVNADWLDELLSVIGSDEKIGAVQPQIRDLKNLPIILSEGNLIDRLGFVHVKGRGRHPKLGTPPNPVFAITAACMLFRRSAYETAGGFDGDYFLSYDEVDLCWRTWLAGYSVYYVPSAIIWHKASTTVNTFFSPQLSYFDCRNRLRTIVKNYSSTLLARYLIPSILASFFEATRKLLQNDKSGFIGTARAVGNTITSLNVTLRKRHSIQRTRKITDSYLLRKGLIAPMNFAKLYQRSIRFD